MTYFVFQAMFVATAATIISGAVAERMKFNGYLIMTVLATGVIYPVVGHWAWSSSYLSKYDTVSKIATGWLSEGFIDFYGRYNCSLCGRMDCFGSSNYIRSKNR